jgi:hypothetical protein
MATTKREFLNELVKANDLIVEEDIFKLQRGGKSIPIITRTGIEKIQYTNEIKVSFELLNNPPERDFAVVKAVAVKGDTTIETFGSALYGKAKEGNTTHLYLVEMAEKRALSRAVLKFSGAYKYGVYGQDESEDFKE